MLTRTYTCALVIAALALPFVLVGCGGGNEGTATTGAASGSTTNGSVSATGGTGSAPAGKSSTEDGSGSTPSRSRPADGGNGSTPSGNSSTVEREGSAGKIGREEGDSAGGGENAANVPKAVFIKQADKVCAKASGKSEAELRPYLEEGLKSITEEAEMIVNQIVAPGLEAEIDKLRTLDQPNGAAGEKADAIFLAMEEAVDEARADPEEYVVSAGVFAKPEQLAKAFGFKACGGP